MLRNISKKIVKNNLNLDTKKLPNAAECIKNYDAFMLHQKQTLEKFQCLNGVNLYSNFQHFINSNLCLQRSNFLSISVRNYSKGKSKGNKGGPVIAHITEDELESVLDVKKFKSELQIILDSLKENFLRNLSVRSNIGSLENIDVDFDGDKVSLSEIAQVLRKNPIMVVVNCTSFPEATPDVKKALLECGMNLNPQQDGTTFFIPIPKVTKEHRESLAKNAKTICDQSKVKLKDVQNKYVKKIGHLGGEMSSDLLFNAQLKIREMTQNLCNEVDQLTKNKQNELLKSTKS